MVEEVSDHSFAMLRGALDPGQTRARGAQ